MIRWGLCCQVVDAPIRFRSATHSYVWKLDPQARAAYLDAIALDNAASLADMLAYCERLDIRAFRISSQIFPLATHPLSGYSLDDLPSAAEIHRRLAIAKQGAVERGIRLSFHPDQFVVLNSARPDVVDASIRELEWQAVVAELVGADAICLHGGSTAGGFDAAIDRLVAGIDRLSSRARSRLALENDDRCFSAIDIAAACLATNVPLVLDAHHHRVLDGGLSIEEATAWALATWEDREPYFHVSSPRGGWGATDLRPHADFIDPKDIPRAWRELGIGITVDIEAKAKERAVVSLAKAMKVLPVK